MANLKHGGLGAASLSYLLLTGAPAHAAEGKGDLTGKEKGGDISAAPRGDFAPAAGDAVPEWDRAERRHVDAPRPYEFGLGMETHAMLVQSDLEGMGANKVYNFYTASARYDITPDDRLTARTGLYQRFIADPGESGVRMDDTTLAYTRTFHLVNHTQLRLAPTVIFPTSFAAQLATLILAGRFRASLDHAFGDLSLRVAATATGYAHRYSSANGGGANPAWSAGAAAEVEYTMPFYRPLAAGLSASGSVVKYLQGTGLPPGDNQATVMDATYTSQPLQPGYGGEVYVRYSIPLQTVIRTDVTAAYSLGDPSLGILHDGVPHLYLFWRTASQVYGALAVRY